MVSDDAVTLRANAINCRLYEEDQQPSLLNIGTTTEPNMVPVVEAWRGFYARSLTLDLKAVPERVRAVREWAQKEWKKAPAVTTPEENRVDRRDWDCAVELCDRSLELIRDAGAETDVYARRRLLAGLASSLVSESMGAIPGVSEGQGRTLIEELAQIDEDERHGR